MNTPTPIPELAQVWMDAWIARDAAALEAILAQDYALFGAAMGARAVERGEWLAMGLGDYVGTSATFADPLVRPLGAGLAAMSTTWSIAAHIGPEDVSGRYWITDVWREVPGSRFGRQVVLRSSVNLDTLAASTRAFATPR